MRDFDTIPKMEDIKKGVEFINSIIESDNKNELYIHCKAGKGRSCLLTVCYLMQVKIQKRV